MEQPQNTPINLLLNNIDSDEYKNPNYKFPFNVTISFNKLIEHIEEAAICDNNIKKEFAANILKEINKNPGIRSTFKNADEVKPFEELLYSMMMFVFPNAFWEKQTYALTNIFKGEVFFASPKYRELILNGSNIIGGELNIDEVSYNFGTTVGSFAQILNIVYGFDLRFEFPLIYKIPHPETGLDRYFKLNLANEFADIKIKGKLKKFSEDQKREIIRRIYDIQFLKETIPTEDFEYTGFLVINAINISDTEILSAIKKDFIEKHGVSMQTSFLKLQHNIRSLLKESSVSLGIADTFESKDPIFSQGNKLLNNFQIGSFCDLSPDKRSGSIYETCTKERRICIIDDIENYPDATAVEKIF